MTFVHKKVFYVFLPSFYYIHTIHTASYLPHREMKKKLKKSIFLFFFFFSFNFEDVFFFVLCALCSFWFFFHVLDKKISYSFFLNCLINFFCCSALHAIKCTLSSLNVHSFVCAEHNTRFIYVLSMWHEKEVRKIFF